MKDERDDFLGKMYLEQQWPLDKLPYTKEFDAIWEAYNKRFGRTKPISKKALWRFLVDMRKTRKTLPNKEKANTTFEKKRQAEERKKQFEGFGFDV